MKEKNVPEQLKSLVRTIPDWPKKGIQFRDITTLLNDPKGYHLLIEELTKRYKDNKPDVIAGIEARGFILGGALAYTLGVGFVPIRKKGKLPGETVSQEYELEYGTDKIEMHKDAIKPGQKVLIVDDLIATAGTSIAAVKLVKQLGGNILECVFIIELPELQGRAKLEKECKKIFCLFEFEGE
ncbi:MAG: adenine phosphoribosyltransferase [Nanoarchaeota archaeon]|nr:adenine phosphoribosyltransferase [Nanoarchaeota archaeon]